jgi:hypothetical protein
MTPLYLNYIALWKSCADGIWRLHRDIWNTTVG